MNRTAFSLRIIFVLSVWTLIFCHNGPFFSSLLAQSPLDSQSVANKSESIIRTVAGAGGKTDNGDSGDSLTINIGQTFGVEIGPDGCLYVCEVENHRIRKIDLKKRVISTVAGCGEKGYDGDGGLATNAKLNEPYEVRFDDQGNLYFVEMMNHVVRKIESQTGIISTIAGCGEKGFGGDGGAATKAKLNRPHSIALDKSGFLYIADIGNHRIRKLNLAAGTISTFAGNGEKKMPTAGQIASGQLIGPRALFVSKNELYVALREGHSVWKIGLKSERLVPIAGSGKKGHRDVDGNLMLAQFNGPKGIAVDTKGRIYVVDTENQAIRRIVPSEKRVETIAGVGPKARGFRGDGLTAKAAWMDRPHGICLDAKGRVYVGDTNNHRVREIEFPTTNSKD